MIHNNRMLLITFLVILLTSLSLTAFSQGMLTYSNAELDVILAPIALYPDPLIAQILPAATYPDELYEANDLIRSGRSRYIDRQPWDVSVKAVSYYPSVLYMMVDRPDWTIAVGQAYCDEPDHVMRSIQRLRSRARSYGYLSTNRYQRVYVDNGYIRIVPVQSRYIYVPQYNPQVVYVRRSSGTSNLISFGLGLLIGAWLNRDVDWHHDRIYYHGWDGGGWIGNSRPRVSIHNTYYVNSNYRNSPISVDRRVRTRDLGEYRTKIRSSVGTYRLPESRRPGRSITGHKGTVPSVGKAQRSTQRAIHPSSKPSKRVIGRTSTHGAKTSSIRKAPKSTHQSIRSKGKSGHSVTKSHRSSGSSHVSGKSGSKSKGGDRGQSQHGSKGGDHGQSKQGGKGH